MKLSFLNLLILLTLTACAAIEDGRVKPPLVYRIDIQQGNVVDQKMVNKLKVGMDEKQVRFIMGTPLLKDTFHPNRWDYLFYYQESDNQPEQRHITLYFKEGRLSHMTGDIQVSHIPIVENPQNTEKSVVVPDGYNDRGLFEKWFDKKPEFAEPRESTLEELEAEAEAETETVSDELTEETGQTVDAATEESLTEETKQWLEEETEVISAESEAESNVDEEFEDSALETAEPEATEAEEEGFFSRMWDKLSGDDE